MGLNKLKTAALVLAALLVLWVGLVTAGLMIQTLPEQNTPDRTEEQVIQVPEDTLQSTWRITNLDIPKGEIREEFEKLGKVVVKGNKATLVLDLMGMDPDKKEIWIADFTILKVDPTKSPATIDLRLDKRTVIWSPKDDPDANKPKTLQGIYSLEGDTLKLFFDEGRPKEFPKQAKQGVITLQREQKQKGKIGGPAQIRRIEPSRTLITGVIDGQELEKLSPPNGFITKLEDFEKLWKAWISPEEKVPEVDFKSELIIVANSREGPIKDAVLTDEKQTGNMKIKVELDRKSEGKALQVLIAVFPRAGIKTIEGRAITDK